MRPSTAQELYWNTSLSSLAPAECLDLNLLPLACVALHLQRGQTALHDAAYAGYINMVEELIEGGATVDVKDVKGQTPLAQAAWNGHAGVARLLLSAGAKPEVADPVSQASGGAACPSLHDMWWCPRGRDEGQHSGSQWTTCL